MVVNDPVNLWDYLGLTGGISQFSKNKLDAAECEKLSKYIDIFLKHSRSALSDYHNALNGNLDTRDFYAWSSFAVSTAGTIYNGIRGAAKTAKDALASDRRSVQMFGDRNIWQGTAGDGIKRAGGTVDGINYAPGVTYDVALQQVRDANMTGVLADAGLKGLVTGGVNAALDFNAAESITGLLDERVDTVDEAARLNYEDWRWRTQWLQDQYESKCGDECLDQ